MALVRIEGERRVFPRHRVRVVVSWCKRVHEVMVGEICDVSAEGVFLVSRTALPDDVGVGDSTRITVRTDYGEEDLVGMVRWRGFHPLYEAIGCGIRLDEPSRAAIARLFPQLLGRRPGDLT
jgi:hypothetical protein